MITLLVSLEFYTEEERAKLAMAVASTLLHKIPVLPEKVLGSLLAERLVENGVVLVFFTHFCKVFLAQSSPEELVALLGKAKVASRIEEYFPMSKRSYEAQVKHFEDAELPTMAAWLARRNAQLKVAQIRGSLKEMLEGTEDVTTEKAIKLCRKKQEEGALTDADVAKTILIVLLESVSPSGKGTQQLAQALLKLLKEHAVLLNTFVKTAKDERLLLDAVQTFCYETTAFLKLFPELVRILYELDVLAEDTILGWVNKGSNPKGRGQFLKELEPFVKWLEEAEEEEDEEEDEE